MYSLSYKDATDTCSHYYDTKTLLNNTVAQSSVVQLALAEEKGADSDGCYLVGREAPCATATSSTRPNVSLTC
jgi:hypothetical protein